MALRIARSADSYPLVGLQGEMQGVRHSQWTGDCCCKYLVVVMSSIMLDTMEMIRLICKPGNPSLHHECLPPDH